MPNERAALVTRPEPGGTETAALLAERGWTALLAPMLTIEPRAPVLPPPSRVQALLVSSGNALTAIPASHYDLPLLAVGDATAARARRLGFAHVDSADGDAADLARLAGRLCDPRGGTLLLVAGAGHGSGLAAGLRRRGFRVLRRIGYVSVPVAKVPAPARAAVLGGSVAAALFFSAAAARAFVRISAGLEPALRRIDALAIGRAAGMALEPLPWRSIRIAARPTADEMMALLP